MTRSPTLRYNSENDPARLRSRTVEPEKGKGRKRRPRVKRIENADELVEALREDDKKAFLVLDENGMRIEWEDAT